MDKKLMYLDTYVLQQDMRIRMPKSIITNLNVQKGISKFDIYLEPSSHELILKIHNSKQEVEYKCDL